jgi:CelD/BcsL family acetyltransferase involved in cellulose biosynthesis/glycosyltransferase involved in cell wall biosynthesis
VSEDSVGGAEQVLSLLERALVAAGHRSIVIAHEASRVAGELVPIGDAGPSIEGAAFARTHAAVAYALARVLAAERVDAIHAHGLDFDRYMPPPGPPLLATLHLPVSWYSREALAPKRSGVHLCCVSQTQSRDLPSWAAPSRVIDNGVSLDVFRPAHKKRSFALFLGRICEEKAVHEALDACTAAGTPLVVAGAVLPWPAHRRYFERYVAPRLRGPHRFIGPAGLGRKRRLLAAARCLLVTSRAPETSSLVAMEALASGTPVIAYPSGALTAIVEHGRTGFVVDGPVAMARALPGIVSLSPDECRASAEARFSGRRMSDAYLGAYRDVADTESNARVAGRALELTTEVVDGIENLARLEHEWIALWERCPWATPFQRPEWLVAYASAFCYAGGRPWALASRRGGALVALLPLMVRPAEGARAVALLGEGISDYLDIIGRPGDVDVATARFFEALGACAAKGETVLLDALRGGSPLLLADRPRGVGEQVFGRDPSPVLPLAGKVDPLPESMRRSLRRQGRRAAALGTVEFIEAPGTGDLGAWLEILFRLHGARWEGRGQPGVLHSRQLRSFYKDAVTALARARMAYVFGLRIGGRPAAAMLALRDARSFYFYIGGFDPAYAAVSPGTLLIGYAVDRAHAERAAEIDFLRGTEGYKYRFGAEDRCSRARRFSASSPRSQSADFASLQNRVPVQPNGQSS